MKIVIPGGSGQVGRILARHFLGTGDDVTVLTRRPVGAPWHEIEWDGETRGPWADALSGCDACINLAGRSHLLISDERFSGVVNLASPHPLPNAEFLRALRQAWGTRIGVPLPPWLVEIGTFVLRTESELVLKSRRVIPGRLLAAGVSFQFPEWPPAARDLVARWRAHRNGPRTRR